MQLAEVARQLDALGLSRKLKPAYRIAVDLAILLEVNGTDGVIEPALSALGSEGGTRKVSSHPV